MDAQAIIAVAGAVVALVSLIKWAGLKDAMGPLAVLFCSLLGVIFWGIAEGQFERTRLFEYFAGWIAVATSAAGVFGFTRATPHMLTKMRDPEPKE